MSMKDIFTKVPMGIASTVCLFVPFLAFALFSDTESGMPGTARAQASDYRTVDGPCDFVFPRDHGDHPGYRTEWWYYTGNLETDKGRRFGFQLTFFRTQLSPDAHRLRWPRPASAWRTDQVYLAHAAISDPASGVHMSDEKTARGAAGLAGVERSPSEATVYLGQWQAGINERRHRLSMVSDAFGLELELIPLKPPVTHGMRGYSRKGSGPGRASCYYSLTRLSTKGTLSVRGHSMAVTGLSWMDHEYSTAPLEPGLQGWDWFSLQFDDGSELMLYGLRRADGTWHPSSSGTFVPPAGPTAHLTRAQFRINATRYWKSPHTGGSYPVGWLIEIPVLDLRATVKPIMDDQEMRMTSSTGVNYWEGSVTVSGRRSGQAVSGRGYAELTGYAGAFDAPL